MSISFDYTGKSVLVVGGSSGIGNGIAQGFRNAGAKVHVWGTRAKAGDYKEDEGSNLEGLNYAQVDVSKPADILKSVQQFKALDVLVLSQGIVMYNRGEFEQEGWDKVMSVNLDSLMICARSCHAALSKTKGHLIIISSVSGLSANIGNPAYAASKAGAISLTKTLAQAWARDGIHVNGIAPGLVDTKLTKVTTETPKRLETALRAIPLRRAGLPEDMAGAALFLASPLADYICGHTLIVDGGLTL